MTLKQPSDFNFNDALKRISGDEHDAGVAFRELHNYFGTAIYVTAKRFMKSKELADDLVQEVFTTVWVRRKQLDHVLDFEGYLIGMTKREALNLIRKHANANLAKLKHLDKMAAQEDPLPAKYSEQLDKIIDLLPSPRKQIFQLAKIDGLGRKVIAEEFKMSVDTVHWHVSQAVKFIRAKRHDVISALIIGIAFILRFTGLGQ